MNIIIWLVIGGLIGWAASIFMRTDGHSGSSIVQGRSEFERAYVLKPFLLKPFQRQDVREVIDLLDPSPSDAPSSSSVDSWQ